MQGLDSLAVRARQYYAAGARFAKWRSPIEIDTAKGRPTELAINANMSDLARYALICQSEGLMPIVEPDVVLAGTHSLAVAVEVNVRVQAELFHAMRKHGVYMAGTTLKPNMVLPGLECPVSYSVEEIARANAFVMEQCLPAALTSVNYLSGGQSLTQALVRLNAIAQHTRHLPWNTSFSWSKALQLPLLELCGEKKALCLQEMGCLYIEELKLASLASLGTLIDDEYTTINEDDNGDHKGV
uniref:fructose-bisphosphate aldolase n=1 Tax=Proboscia inermis TaxID=420281 RepID=A0A7S0GA25_9STRA|mmetsp:Transcript_12879/g.12979  ORF Transcript_12879/g.12979 Transcript_12879/m.12979 type:complete len:242 (+) Transcript_12879:169-894(+)